MGKVKKWLYWFLMFVMVSVIMCGCSGDEYNCDSHFSNLLSDATSIIYSIETESDCKSDKNSNISNSTISVSENASEEKTEMSVHFLDVGQGDATLVVNGDHAMLIDAGVDDCGTKLQLYLEKQGVKYLDYLILTHTDADHIGAADVIVTKFQIGTVLMGDYPKNTATYRDTLSALKEKDLSYVFPSASNTYMLGDAAITFIGPGKEYDNANDTSLCFILQKGNITFLFTGDASAEVEKNMIDAGWDLHAEVYHVAHHGSRYSSSEAFIEKIFPLYAVISCGANNEYGHPHAQTLNTLRKYGVELFRTDEQGVIIVTTSGSELEWNCAPSNTWIPGN